MKKLKIALNLITNDLTHQWMHTYLQNWHPSGVWPPTTSARKPSPHSAPEEPRRHDSPKDFPKELHGGVRCKNAVWKPEKLILPEKSNILILYKPTTKNTIDHFKIKRNMNIQETSIVFVFRIHMQFELSTIILVSSPDGDFNTTSSLQIRPKLLNINTFATQIQTPSTDIHTFSSIRLFLRLPVSKARERGLCEQMGCPAPHPRGARWWWGVRRDGWPIGNRAESTGRPGQSANPAIPTVSP